MNIWLINHHALPPTEGGGTRHYSHARELIRRGHQVEIVACSFQHLRHEHMAISPGCVWERQICDGVPFTWIRALGYRANSLPRIINMLQFANRVRAVGWAKGLQKPHLVLGSSPHPFAALAAERCAARFGVPFILEIRDVWPYVLTEVGGYSERHPFIQLVDRVMRYLYRRAARIVMFSGSSTSLLARSGADPSKIVWIPNGVDLQLYPAPSSPKDGSQFTVTYLGAHNQWNSLDAVLDAAKLLSQDGRQDVLFRFVGDGVDRQRLIERARKEGIANVRFDAPVPKKQVPQLLHDSDALIINSRKDGVSKNWMSYNKIYDYLAAGRPIVFGCCASDNPVKDSGAGISVEADNPAELARAVALLASQPAEVRWEYGMRGRQYVEQNYSVAKLVDRFEQLALEVTGQARGQMRRSSRRARRWATSESD